MRMQMGKKQGPRLHAEATWPGRAPGHVFRELGELRVKQCKGGAEGDPGVKHVTRGVKWVELEDKKERWSSALDPTHATPTQNDNDSSQGAIVVGGR